MIRRFWIAAIAVAVSCGAALGNDSAWSVALRQLDDEQYLVREAATQKLVDAGTAIIPQLSQIIEKGSPEAAWRASTVLERMALEGDEAALKAVKAVVDALAKSSRPGLAQLGAELAERQKFFRHERAIAQLERLGGRVAVTGELEDEGLEVMDAAAFAIEAFDAEDRRAVAVELEDVEVIEPTIRSLEEQAAKFEPLEETFLDKFKAEALAKRVPPGADLPPEAEVDEDEPAMEAAVEVIEVDDVMIAEEVEGEEEEVIAASAVLGKHWRGGDDGVEQLRDVRMLTTLRLDHAPVSDKALSVIAKLSDLQSLTIRGGKFSPAALRRLHKEKPHLSLTVIGPAMMGVSTTGAPCTVQRVVPGSGAEKAGLRAGDVIRSVDHERVEEFSDLSYVLFARKAGDRVRVRFEREGKKMETEAVLMPRAGGG